MAKINQEKFVTIEKGIEVQVAMFGVPRTIIESMLQESMHCALPGCKGACIFDSKTDTETKAAKMCTADRKDVLASLVTYDELMAMKEDEELGND